MVKHIQDAHDHAVATRDIKGIAELRPRPTQKQLAERTGLNKTAVSRCLKDTSARELRLYWEIALDLDRILSFRGRISGGSAA